MKKIAWVVLLAMGVVATTQAFAQDKKATKTTQPASSTPKYYGRLSGKQLIKTSAQQVPVASAKAAPLAKK